MTPSGEDDRLRDAFTSLGENARPTEQCPPAAPIWAALRGELDPVETREVGQHAISCPACAEAWRLAHDVVSEVFSGAAVGGATGKSRG